MSVTLRRADASKEKLRRVSDLERRGRTDLRLWSVCVRQ